MKKRILGLLALTGVAVTGIALTSCSNSGEKVVKTDVYMQTLGSVITAGQNEVLFKANSSVPYILLDEGTELLSVLRTVNLDGTDYNVKMKKENNDYVIYNETGAKCTISKDNQTLTFDDYDKFTSVVNEAQKPLSLVTLKKNFKPIKMISCEYTPGKSVTVDLKPYSKLDIYTKDDKCYLPLSVFNSVLYNTTENVNLAYNGNALFLIPGNSLSEKDENGNRVPSELGAKFRDGAAKDKISDEYLEYFYQSLCFDFDYEYGLKDKFTKFDSFLKEHNCKDRIYSTDPKQIDSYLAAALTWLNDGHTALVEFSNLYKYADNKINKDYVNPIKQNWEEANDNLENAKKEAIKQGKIKTGIEYKGNTAFVTFDEFTNINPDLLYEETTSKKDLEDDITGMDDIPGLDFSTGDDNITQIIKQTNTACIFNQLYKDLTSDTYKNTIKNVVVDLSTNNGGFADTLVYSLSTLIGNVTVDLMNPLSDGRNHQVYKADMNADGTVDDKDKSLSELGFNIYFIDSKYSFSSANSMAVLAKLNNSKVITLGDKTGGGPCSIRYVVNPIGSATLSSSLNTFAKQVNGKYVNIDDGVAADYALTEAQMIDRDYVVNNISKWTSK